MIIINSAARFCDISLMLPFVDSLIQLAETWIMYFKTLSHIYWILCGKENYEILQKSPFSFQMNDQYFSMGNCLHKAAGLSCISIAQAMVIGFMSVSMT